MSYRLQTSDTAADDAIREVLKGDSLTGFTVIAGAGSGKTTSLVKALAHVTQIHGSSLRSNSQQVACITYTEIAANEIFQEIGQDPLAWVSTIHSFLWEVIKPFQRDIRRWAVERVGGRIADLQEKQAAYTSRTRESTRIKDDVDLERRRAQLVAAEAQIRWTYGIGSDFTKGVLGHAEVIAMVPQLVIENDLLARIIARRFPFIFVDESQDAFPDVVACLKKIWSVAAGKMSLGFFGDPMQQIYLGGIKDIEPLDGWQRIEKPENFRSSRRVLQCVNAVRSADDGLEQITGLENQSEGEAFCFVVSAESDRDESLDAVGRWLDENSVTGGWTGTTDSGGAKVLMIEHRMAAGRLGFPQLHEAFRNGDAGLTQSFEEGHAWPLEPFREVINPLCEVSDVRSPAVVRLLIGSPLLRDQREAGDVKAALEAGRQAVEKLREMADNPASVLLGDILRFTVSSGLVELDPRLDAFLNPEGEHQHVVLTDRTRSVLDAMTACVLGELTGYSAYVQQHSPYATHQGTKGAEFDQVIVVLDDADSRHRQFSYDKLLGLKALSETDERHRAAGEDSTLERTRRLLYVCLSRARQAVAVLLFATDVDAAVTAVQGSDFGPHVRLVTEADLTAVA